MSIPAGAVSSFGSDLCSCSRSIKTVHGCGGMLWQLLDASTHLDRTSLLSMMTPDIHLNGPVISTSTARREGQRPMIQAMCTVQTLESTTMTVPVGENEGAHRVSSLGEWNAGL